MAHNWAGVRFARVAIALLTVLLGASALTVAPADAALSPLTGPGSIAAGMNHACAVSVGGTVKCWGLDNAGQLGDGGPTDQFGMQSKPVKVPVTGVVSVVSGDDHSCALFKNRRVKCWGDNDAGQLGNGTRTNSSSPVSVKGANGNGLLDGVVALVAAQDHTCALLKAGAGTVKCWGRNNAGVLGNGSPNRQQALTPESVPALTRVVAISTGIHNTCVVLIAGTVKCWGFSEYGELGPGIVGPQDCPFGDADFQCNTNPVAVKGISNATAVSVRDHSSCVIVKNGKITCWGDSKPSFVTVPGLSGATAIASSGDAVSYGDYSCALMASKTVKCWGWNQQGQLGNGTTKNGWVPTTVSGIKGVTTISAGVTFACARLVSGAASCWGANNYGQLGNGRKPSNLKPVTVVGL